jgi:hypothetical protein
MSHELPATTADMAVLPGILGCWTLRRTAQVRLRSNPAVGRDYSVAQPSPLTATVIREKSELEPTADQCENITFFSLTTTPFLQNL